MTDNKQTIGIIGALQEEVRDLISAMEVKQKDIVSGMEFVSGTLEDKNIVVVQCGVGKVFAAICAQTLIVRFGVSCVLNIGVAGSLTPDLSLCEAVVADALVQHDMNTTALGDPLGMISGINVIQLPTDETMRTKLKQATEAVGIASLVGTVASGDLFVAKESTKAHIRENFGALACEMEGAAVAQTAYVNHIPFAVLRVISDGGDGMEFTTFANIAAKQSCAIVRKFLSLM